MKTFLVFSLGTWLAIGLATAQNANTKVRFSDTKNTVPSGGTSGQVLTSTGAAYGWATPTAVSYAVRYNAQTGTAYTLTEADNGKLLTLTNTATVTITLAPGLSTGWNCVLEQTGAGSVVWANGTGVSTNTYPASSTKTTAIRARVTVEHRGSNVFYLNGQIAP